MIHDYLELPEVVFLTKHWLGLLVVHLVVGVLAWLVLVRRRRP